MPTPPQITLKQLHYFEHLARSGNFSAAADAVNISQPAISLQIKALEETFGGPLIERNVKGVFLTPLGEEVRRQAADILASVVNLQELAITSESRPPGSTRLGLIPTVAPYLLPHIYPKLKKAFPDYSFAIREGRTNQLVEELLTNQIDIAIMALPLKDQNLLSRSLFVEPFWVAAGPGFSSDGRKQLGGKDLKAHDILLLEEGHCLRDQTIQACGINVGTALNSFGASSLGTVVEMVANGFGITLLPEMALKKEAADKRIQLFPMKAPGPSRELALVWRSTSPYGPFFGAVADIIADAKGDEGKRNKRKAKR